LVVADEVIERCGSMDPESDAQLKSIQSPDLTLKTVVRDEVSRVFVMGVEQPEDLIPSPCDVSGEANAKSGEFRRVELCPANLDGEHRDRLDQCQPRDVSFGPNLVDELVYDWGAVLGVIVLDQGAGVKEAASI
jgi:hypothetical protein